jgi:hypothetical protein
LQELEVAAVVIHRDVFIIGGAERDVFRL